MRVTRRTIDTAAVDTIVGYRLRRAQMAVFARFIDRFADLDLRPADYSVLVLLADNPGLRPSEVAASLGIKRANFVALANALEARGLVVRHRTAGDRRAVALELTDAGRALVMRARAVQDAFETELVDRLGGPAERDRLLALLAHLD
jgi:DNA-binding MarR family transcriptional regulator